MLGIGPASLDLQKTRRGIDRLLLELFECDRIEDVNAEGLQMVKSTTKTQKSGGTILAAECDEWTIQ